jgi:hypothetical protein
MVVNTAQFKASVSDASPAAQLGAPLTALWWAAKDDWDRAHRIVQDETTADAAWVHAYLHRVEGDLGNAGAHFPKFVLDRGNHFHELRKVLGTSKLVDSSAAFLFEVPGLNSPRVVQELQIGGTTYWYRRAGKPAANGSLQAEWDEIVSALLRRGIA